MWVGFRRVACRIQALFEDIRGRCWRQCPSHLVAHTVDVRVHIAGVLHYMCRSSVVVICRLCLRVCAGVVRPTGEATQACTQEIGARKVAHVQSLQSSAERPATLTRLMQSRLPFESGRLCPVHIAMEACGHARTCTHMLAGVNTAAVANHPPSAL